MLRIEGLSKSYGRFVAVRDISFKVERGSSVLLLGPNGAGKTTIIKCIMGLLRFQGEIFFDGHSVRKDSVDIRTKIGYVPQQSAYYDNLTVYDQAKFVSRLKRTKLADVVEKLKTVNLWTFKALKVRALSSGMKQRLGIALALLHDPQFLIFDEPMGSVDMRGQLEFQSTLEQFTKEGRTMLITTHLSGLEGNASEVVVLNAGRVVAVGKPADLLRKVRSRDIVHIKVRSSDAERVISLLNSKGATDVTRRGEWIEFSAEPLMKAVTIDTLIREGCQIDDLVIEPPEIGEEYVKLLDAGDSS